MAAGAAAEASRDAKDWEAVRCNWDDADAKHCYCESYRMDAHGHIFVQYHNGDMCRSVEWYRCNFAPAYFIRQLRMFPGRILTRDFRGMSRDSSCGAMDELFNW